MARKTKPKGPLPLLASCRGPPLSPSSFLPPHHRHRRHRHHLPLLFHHPSPESPRGSPESRHIRQPNGSASPFAPSFLMGAGEGDKRRKSATVSCSTCRRHVPAPPPAWSCPLPPHADGIPPAGGATTPALLRPRRARAPPPPPPNSEQGRCRPSRAVDVVSSPPSQSSARINNPPPPPPTGKIPPAVIYLFIHMPPATMRSRCA